MTNKQKLTRYVTIHAHCFNVRMTEHWMATVKLGDQQQFHLCGNGGSNLDAIADIVSQVEKNAELKKWVLAQ